MVRKRIFILESEIIDNIIKEDLERFAENGEIEVTTSTLVSEFKRHLPKNYDLYMLHAGRTEIDAIQELKREQPWSKIFVRDSMKENIMKKY